MGDRQYCCICQIDKAWPQIGSFRRNASFNDLNCIFSIAHLIIPYQSTRRLLIRYAFPRKIQISGTELANGLPSITTICFHNCILQTVIWGMVYLAAVRRNVNLTSLTIPTDVLTQKSAATYPLVFLEHMEGQQIARDSGDR